MSDLISRGAALKLSYCAIKPNRCPSVVSVVDVEDIEKIPAVDAVPVVRCRECKHRGGYHCPMYHTETSLDDLDGFDDYNVDKTDGDGFCHRGERRDNVNLNDLRDAVYADAVAHGLWEDAEKFAEELEFDEDVTPEERESAKKFSKWYDAANLVFFESEEILTAVEEYKYDSAIEEIADTIIMCMSAAGYLDIDIDAAVRRKMEINKGRAWKHGRG